MVYGVQVLGDPFIILWYDNIISLKIIFFTAGSYRVMWNINKDVLKNSNTLENCYPPSYIIKNIISTDIQ